MDPKLEFSLISPARILSLLRKPYENNVIAGIVPSKQSLSSCNESSNKEVGYGNVYFSFWVDGPGNS